MVLGEDSAHTRLQDLLRHYTASPLSPYGETLTEPLARQVRPPGALTLTLSTGIQVSASPHAEPRPHHRCTRHPSSGKTAQPYLRGKPLEKDECWRRGL